MMVQWKRVIAAAVLALGAATPAMAEDDTAAIGFDANRPVAAYAPEDRLAWALTFTNPGPAAPDATMRWRLTGWSDVVAEQEHKLHVTEKINAPRLELPAPGLGWYELAVEVRTVDGRVLAAGATTFTVAEPYRPSNGAFRGRGFRYGIGSHPNRLAAPELLREQALMSSLGVDIQRVEISWNRVEPEDNQWAFDQMDTVIRGSEAAGIEVQGLLAYTTQWGTTGDPNARDWLQWARAMPRMDAFLDYARTTVRRYGHVRYWEVWNEPDIGFWLGTTPQFVDLFNQTSAAIKETSPAAQVLNGGLAMVRRPPNPDFVRDFTATADERNWDVWAYHDYHTFTQMLDRSQEQGAFHRQLDKRMPVWVNEGGFHTLMPGGEREQAVTLVKKYATAPSLGIGAYFWYNLRDDGTSATDKEHHFGLVRRNFDPKPSFAAYQRLIRELGPRSYVARNSSEPMPSGTWAHLYTAAEGGAAGEHVLVLWREGETRSKPTWIGWVDGAAQVTGIVDCMGNPVEQNRWANGTVAGLSSEPLYVRFRGPAAYPSIAPLVTVPGVIAAPRDSETSTVVTLHNPTTAEVTYDLELSSDSPGVEPRLAVSRIAIPASESGQVRAAMVVAPDGQAKATAGDLRLKLTSSDVGPVTAVLPYVIVDRLPRLSTAPELAAPLLAPEALILALNSRDDVHNLYSAEPAPQMQWAGPADLSGAASLAYDDEHLYIEVVATDDRHHAVVGEAMWEADCLQLGVWLGQNPADYLELGVSLAGEAAGGWVYRAPKASSLRSGPLADRAPVAVARSGSETRYRIHLPWSTLGVAGPTPNVRLSFIVNDDDGLGRKQWLQLTRGIGDGKDPTLFRLFALR